MNKSISRLRLLCVGHFLSMLNMPVLKWSQRGHGNDCMCYMLTQVFSVLFCNIINIILAEHELCTQSSHTIWSFLAGPPIAVIPKYVCHSFLTCIDRQNDKLLFYHMGESTLHLCFIHTTNYSTGCIFGILLLHICIFSGGSSLLLLAENLTLRSFWALAKVIWWQFVI